MSYPYTRRHMRRRPSQDWEEMPQRESAVNRSVSEALRAFGFKVYNFAAPGALPHSARGFADIVALRADCPALFLQVKREDGGQLSLDQREFAEACREAQGVVYAMVTCVDDLLSVLHDIGLIAGEA